ncbi:hypothetical protein ACFC25_20235 [Pseudarthrobacter sp. NPDC055928]|uniref:hypothetical protein n=1 Tax=Pseudarthrobacter sp. NPDC055928 TaxID=3345661 RepID=UPI0035DC38B0
MRKLAAAGSNPDVHKGLDSCTGQQFPEFIMACGSVAHRQQPRHAARHARVLHGPSLSQAQHLLGKSKR